MNETDARDLILGVIRRIAPEADLAMIEPEVELREQLDIDSMDFLNVIIGIHEATGIDIPESDYEHFETLEAASTYLAKASAAG
ncbi:MAG: acyl carrier protein [Dehalococcoidia bacterium]|nr:acyl carrier protein [Dehalococcoidia bacterium]